MYLVLIEFYLQMFSSHQQAALQYLFKQSNTENFNQWKFYLILVQTIASAANPETTAYIKSILISVV